MRAARPVAEAWPAPVLALGLLVGLGGALAAGFVEAFEAAGLAGAALALALLALRRRRHAAGAYAVFALRLALALPLLTGGMALLRGPVLAQALGVAWLAGGLLLALGLLTPWVALYAALAMPLALRFGGSAAWVGLAVAALALALADDDRLSLDGLLAPRGGLFPTLRVEVLLEPKRP